MIRLGPAFDQMRGLGRVLSSGVGNLSTTQKVPLLTAKFGRLWGNF